MKGFAGAAKGKCVLVSDQWKTFFKKPVQFVIQLDFAYFQELTPEQQAAIIDHEMCHIDYSENEKTGERKPKIRIHDFEEFCEIIDRHGAWTPALELAKKLMVKKEK